MPRKASPITTKACSVEGCSGNSHWRAGGARGWCKTHYARNARNGTTDLTRRGYIKGCTVCTVCGAGGRLNGGLCAAHYHRLCRYGDPLKGGAPRAPKGSVLAYVYRHMHDGCSYPWPFATCGAGYGQMKVDGERTLVNRFVCELVNGPAPSADHEAAHSCGKPSCFFANCLRWATTKQNNGDKLVHGTHNRGERHSMVKLTEDNVRYIRRSEGAIRGKVLAEKFGVTPSHISSIRQGRSWSWLEQEEGDVAC